MTIIKRIAGLALAATLALPAQAIEPDRAAAFIDALRGNDCAMSEAEADTLLPPLGFVQSETMEIVEVLMGAGLAGLSDDFTTLELDAALCAASPDDDAATFAEALDSFGPPPAPPPPGEADIAMLRDQLGIGFVRDMVRFHAEDMDCVLDLTDRATLEADIADLAAEIMSFYFNVSPILPPDVAAELQTMVAAALDDPGEGWREEDGRLVLEDCAE